MILAAMGFSVMGALAKFSMGRIPPMETVFFRATTCIPFLALWMWQQKIPLIAQNNRVLLLRSAAGFTALSLNFYATRKMELAEVTILINTSPLFVTLLSVLFLKEKISWKLATLIALAFLGAILIIKPSPTHFNFWSIFALISSFFAAVAYVSIKELHKSDSSYTIVFNFLFFSSAVSLLLFHRTFLLPHGIEWIALLATGIIGTIAQVLMTHAYKLSNASIVSPYFFSAVLFAALWGILFWGEIPDIFSITGGILIVLCGIGILRVNQAVSDVVENLPE